MQQKITGYHKDDENHWVAELECGHNQHVRHDPPFFSREWVTTEEGRKSHLGHELNCMRCDEFFENVLSAVVAVSKESFQRAYEAAGQSGLCEEGQIEIALDSLNALSREEILERVKRLM